MQTEYDTANFVHVRQAGLGGATLSPEITRHFARKAYACVRDNPLDAAFCTEALRGDALTCELIERYVSAGMNKSYPKMDDMGLFSGQEEVLRIIRGASAQRQKPQDGGIRLSD